MAVQALYQMDVGGTSMPKRLAQFELFRCREEIDGWAYRPADKGYFRHLVTGVVENQKILDPAIHAALPDGWPLTRLDTLLALAFAHGGLRSHETAGHPRACHPQRISRRCPRLLR
jgi:N utilization substance protein B